MEDLQCAPDLVIATHVIVRLSEWEKSRLLNRLIFSFNFEQANKKARSDSWENIPKKMSTQKNRRSISFNLIVVVYWKFRRTIQLVWRSTRHLSSYAHNNRNTVPILSLRDRHSGLFDWTVLETPPNLSALRSPGCLTPCLTFCICLPPSPFPSPSWQCIISCLFNPPDSK